MNSSALLEKACFDAVGSHIYPLCEYRGDGVYLKHASSERKDFTVGEMLPVVFAERYGSWKVCVRHHVFSPENAQVVARCHRAAIAWCREQNEAKVGGRMDI